jgi:type I restriction enzyme S subunit
LSTDGRWQPYPAYKDSGVDWLGEIPKHWSGTTLKRLVAVKITDGPHETPEFVDEGVPFVSAEAVYNGRINFDSKRGYISSELHAQYIKKVYPQRDDVFIVKSGATTGKLAMVDVDFEFSVWSPLALIRANLEKATPRFLFLALHADYAQNQVQRTWSAGTQPNISMAAIERLYVVVPPLAEQRAIAAFLDREMAKIDTLVEKQERLIELLQEKRAALISHAVTKGLDPDVEMKDSGIPWLGEIPERWEVKRFKFLTSFVTSGSRGWAQYYSDEGATFLRIGNLSRESIELDLTDIQHVSPPDGAEGKRTRVCKDDVLISITAYIGSIGVVAQNIGEAYVNQHIALTRPSPRQVEPRWLGYALLSQVGASQFGLLLYGGTKDGLGLDDVRNLSVLAPPLDEQRAIVAHIDRETAKLDALVAKAQEMIERLQEYRTALISATVTGKIDVRES